MSLVPKELKYLSSHEWVRLEADGKTATVGITDHAQDLLGDVVFVQLPDVGLNSMRVMRRAWSNLQKLLQTFFTRFG